MDSEISSTGGVNPYSPLSRPPETEEPEAVTSSSSSSDNEKEYLLYLQMLRTLIARGILPDKELTPEERATIIKNFEKVMAELKARLDANPDDPELKKIYDTFKDCTPPTVDNIRKWIATHGQTVESLAASIISKRASIFDIIMLEMITQGFNIFMRKLEDLKAAVVQATKALSSINDLKYLYNKIKNGQPLTKEDKDKFENGLKHLKEAYAELKAKLPANDSLLKRLDEAIKQIEGPGTTPRNWEAWIGAVARDPIGGIMISSLGDAGTALQSFSSTQNAELSKVHTEYQAQAKGAMSIFDILKNMFRSIFQNIK